MFAWKHVSIDGLKAFDPPSRVVHDTEANSATSSDHSIKLLSRNSSVKSLKVHFIQCNTHVTPHIVIVPVRGSKIFIKRKTHA